MRVRRSCTLHRYTHTHDVQGQVLAMRGEWTAFRTAGGEGRGERTTEERKEVTVGHSHLSNITYFDRITVVFIPRTCVCVCVCADSHTLCPGIRSFRTGVSRTRFGATAAAAAAKTLHTGRGSTGRPHSRVNIPGVPRAFGGGRVCVHRSHRRRRRVNALIKHLVSPHPREFFV